MSRKCYEKKPLLRKCATEGCLNTFVRTCGRHIYCRPCAESRDKKSHEKYRTANKKSIKLGKDRWRLDPSRREKLLKRYRNLMNKKYKDLEWRKKKNQRDAELKHLLKVEVLTRYGKGGVLLCCWRGCAVSDIDCLTLDHVRNNGKEHRASGASSGCRIYRIVKREGFPKGEYQTLCASHQLKKEIKRRRALRLDRGW
jgi:hypothetical protein